MARARNEAPKMHPPEMPPLPEARAKRPKKAKPEGKRTTSRGKELPEGVTRIVPFEDLKKVASAGMAPGERRAKAKAAEAAEDLTHEAVDEEEQGEVVEMEAEPASDQEREEMEWDAKIAEAKKRDFLEGAAAYAKKQAETPGDENLSAAFDDAMEAAEDERALAAYKEAHPVQTDAEGYRRLGMKQQAEEALSKGYEARLKREAREAAAKEKPGASGFTGKEDAWFKQGEEDEARQMAEARATIERGGRGELMTLGSGDIAGNVKEAEALMKGGDLSSREFSLEDYQYLLQEEKRIDQELETAGWWKARGLRKKLEQIRKGGYEGASGSQGLDDYEGQIMQAKSGNGAMKRAAAEKAAPAKKPSFWERLRLGKGR